MDRKAVRDAIFFYRIADIALVGCNAFIPFVAICEKQAVQRRSSTEAEIVALEIALRPGAVPLQSLWDLVVDVIAPDKADEPILGGRPVAAVAATAGKAAQKTTKGSSSKIAAIDV